jgi:hypothetical protein
MSGQGPPPTPSTARCPTTELLAALESTRIKMAGLSFSTSRFSIFRSWNALFHAKLWTAGRFLGASTLVSSFFCDDVSMKNWAHEVCKNNYLKGNQVKQGIFVYFDEKTRS